MAQPVFGPTHCWPGPARPIISSTIPTLQSITLILVTLRIGLLIRAPLTMRPQILLPWPFTSSTPPVTAFLLVMIQVYLLQILAISPLPLSPHHYYLPMCYTRLQCLRTLFWSMFFVSITLLMSCFYYFFKVQDHHTGVTLVCRQRRNDVYYWQKSVPLRSSTLVLSFSVRSSFSTISMWHSHLGHSFWSHLSFR